MTMQYVMIEAMRSQSRLARARELSAYDLADDEGSWQKGPKGGTFKMVNGKKVYRKRQGGGRVKAAASAGKQAKKPALKPQPVQHVGMDEDMRKIQEEHDAKVPSRRTTESLKPSASTAQPAEPSKSPAAEEARHKAIRAKAKMPPPFKGDDAMREARTLIQEWGHSKFAPPEKKQEILRGFQQAVVDALESGDDGWWAIAKALDAFAYAAGLKPGNGSTMAIAKDDEAMGKFLDQMVVEENHYRQKMYEFDSEWDEKVQRNPMHWANRKQREDRDAEGLKQKKARLAETPLGKRLTIFETILKYKN